MAPRYFFDDEDEELDDDLEYDEEFEYDEDEEDEEDDEEQILRVEQAFRRERARIRASKDIPELREMRTVYQTSIAEDELCQAARIRSHDLIELIDDRITDIKASRMTARGR
jgi:hypothetical protein